MTRAARPVQPSGGLLAVHAHPDDETLATGALLAAWAAAGERVTVVTCTRGERGEVIDTPSHRTGLAHLEGDGPALAAHREVELARALAALGVADHAFLDTVPAPGGSRTVRFEDSGMAWVAPGIAGPAPDSGPTAFARIRLDVAAGRLATVIRDRRPDAVVTYDAGGGYGHPDHVRTHEVTVRGLELAADSRAAVVGEPWAVARRWVVSDPAEDVRAARRALATDAQTERLVADHGLTLPDPDGVLPPVAVPAADLERCGALEVDVAPVLDRVLAALAAHETQVQHVGRVPTGASGSGVVIGRYALSNAVLAPVLATMHVRPTDTSTAW
ncbi:PIG-L family deacetylase [Isoptericola croceus]|uniref:PIG-L family deacetylase n=1 Tax=Isoptericola croceus TaxID=3031406 RepID=UPI0023F9498F|nr:PIG-L family deacetylase [Isoptericola croceus]